MTTTTELPVTEHVATALDEILQARAVAMAQPASVERCLRLAELSEVEAAWWEKLSERSRIRVYWRAALVAREHAQHTARGSGSLLWPRLGTSSGPTHRWQDSAPASFGPPCARPGGTGRSSACHEEGPGWGQKTFPVKHPKIGKWSQNSAVGGATSHP